MQEGGPVVEPDRPNDVPANVRQRHGAIAVESAAAAALRRLVLLLFALGVTGAGGDLLLIGHYEDAWQLVPFVLIGASLTALGWWAAGSERRALRAFQVAMLCLIAGGVTGLWLHYGANTEFEREVSPSLEGFDLFWKAIRGASPPSLAPVTLVHLGLLGLAFTYRHPVLGMHAKTTPGHTGDEQ